MQRQAEQRFFGLLVSPLKRDLRVIKSLCNPLVLVICRVLSYREHPREWLFSTFLIVSGIVHAAVIRCLLN